MSVPQSAPAPARVVLEGRYVRLEPAGVQHAADLHRAANVVDAAERFTYLNEPPSDPGQFRDWLAGQTMADPILFAIIDKAGGRALGWQQLMRIEPAHGVIEVGNVYWGPGLSRTRGATEALYLMACHVFDDLGYRRFEWKCNNDNLPSKRAAERFGFTFEGVFRQHMIQKGRNRDTAWFSMLDGEWPGRRAAFEAWLDPANFGPEGRQLAPLRRESVSPFR